MCERNSSALGAVRSLTTKLRLVERKINYNKAKAELYALKRQNAEPEKIRQAQQKLDELAKEMPDFGDCKTFSDHLHVYESFGTGPVDMIKDVWHKFQSPRMDNVTQYARLAIKGKVVEKYTPENALFLDEASKLSRLADTKGMDSPEFDQQLIHMFTDYVANEDKNLGLGKYTLNLKGQDRKKTTRTMDKFQDMLKQEQQQKANLKALQSQGAGSALIQEAQAELQKTQMQLNDLRAQLVEQMSGHLDRVTANMQEQITALGSEDQRGIEGTLKKFGADKSWTRKWHNFSQIMLKGDKGWKTAGKSIGTVALALTGVGAIGLAIGFGLTSSSNYRGLSGQDRENMSTYYKMVNNAQKYDEMAKAQGLI